VAAAGGGCFCVAAEKEGTERIGRPRGGSDDDISIRFAYAICDCEMSCVFTPT
jgi:hypothetical protein